MTSRVRTRALLSGLVVLIVAAVFGSSLMQRGTERHVAAEAAAAVELRVGLLEEGLLAGELGADRSSEHLSRLYAVRARLDQTFRDIRARGKEADEMALVERQAGLLDEFRGLVDRAVRSGDADHALHDSAGRRAEISGAYLAANGELMDELAEERAPTERRATLVLLGVVATIIALFLALNTLFVERFARARARRAERQGAYREILQAARSEAEAYGILARHVAAGVEGSQVTVLNRNNSADRLEAATPLAEGSGLAPGLAGGADPSACLAVRLARTHTSEPGEEVLLSCELCGKSQARTLCTPSLVGGEVVGAVLVEHERPLPVDRVRDVETSVADAAPVVANLRNLAIAELRAATDGLTGLPNQRSAQEMLKRLVAQAGRTLDGLAVLAFDLDEFKAINDSFGHAKGDEVLAAVGDAVPTILRASDAAGRLGGEEFIAMLPGTGRTGAVEVAEKLRHAIAAVRVPGVDRAITASFGVAVYPDDGWDAPSVLRAADRALYAAKRAGRNRVETVEREAATPAV